MAAISTNSLQPLSPVESTLRIQQLTKMLETPKAEVSALRQNSRISPRWWHDHAGRFENDPVFDEIVRLGKLTRAAGLPRRKGRGANS